VGASLGWAMIYIQHRCNKVADLKGLPTEYGVEIDLRSNVSLKNSLHLSHDPYVAGENFEEWILAFKKAGLQGPLILNTKEDGLEKAAIEIVQKNKIDNFLFLDTTFPTLVKSESQSKMMLRISKFEPVEHAMLFKGKVPWTWIDCFGGTPMPVSEIKKLKNKFKICLVSPELHGFPTDTLENFKPLAKLADAVCTKNPELWKNLTRD